jgi:YidC/Oxa1 family membrane protein insertase
MIFVDLFITVIYQPFLNVLVFFYWLDGLVTHGHPDMGVAVILLTIVIRILLLPMSLSEDKSAEERRALNQKFLEIDALYSADPIKQREERKKLFKHNPKVVFAEGFSLFIQTAITLMLWKMFATGLEGQDIHLIYPFIPHVQLPFNLNFWNMFDLSKPNLTLNIIQSLMVFVVETTGILTSPYPPMKGEVVRLQLVLPLVSFIIFLNLPAGKKVFIITTLIITFVLQIYKYVKRRFEDYSVKMAEKAAEAEQAAHPNAPGMVVTTK